MDSRARGRGRRLTAGRRHRGTPRPPRDRASRPAGLELRAVACHPGLNHARIGDELRPHRQDRAQESSPIGLCRQGGWADPALQVGVAPPKGGRDGLKPSRRDPPGVLRSRGRSLTEVRSLAAASCCQRRASPRRNRMWNWGVLGSQPVERLIRGFLTGREPMASRPRPAPCRRTRPTRCACRRG
jgi:hypothetical protein